MSNFKQKSLSIPLLSMVEAGLTKTSLAVRAASCIDFTFYQVGANRRSRRRCQI